MTLTEPKPKRKPQPKITDIRAVYVTHRNCEALLGESWDWVRRNALELGVRVVERGRKKLVPLDAFVRALEAQEQTANDLDPAERVRRALGKRKVG